MFCFLDLPCCPYLDQCLLSASKTALAPHLRLPSWPRRQFLSETTAGSLPLATIKYLDILGVLCVDFNWGAVYDSGGDEEPTGAFTKATFLATVDQMLPTRTTTRALFLRESRRRPSWSLPVLHFAADGSGLRWHLLLIFPGCLSSQWAMTRRRPVLQRYFSAGSALNCSVWRCCS